MRLSAPGQILFIVSLVAAVVAVLVFLGTIALTGIPAFWLMTIAYAVLAAGCLMRGM